MQDGHLYEMAFSGCPEYEEEWGCSGTYGECDLDCCDGYETIFFNCCSTCGANIKEKIKYYKKHKFLENN